MLRMIGALLLFTLGAAAPSIANGQEAFPGYSEVDFFYSQRPELFQDLWRTARTQTVRIAVIGDSQETSPNSHGFQYIPLLNHGMWQRFGNSPETPVVGCFSYGTSPPAHWLLAGLCGTPGPAAARLGSSRILPNARPRAFSTLNSATNITGGNRGQLTILQHDARGVDASTGIPTDVSYFNTSGTVKARIFAATNPTSGEVAYQARPTATSSPSYSAAVTTTGTLTLGLQSPTFAIKSGETSALEFNGNHYMALEVFGTSDTALTDLVGLRFFNETHPQGVVIDSFSLGGYMASTFLSSHADAGEMFAAFGFHAAIIHYGANEAGNVSAAQFRSNLSAVISRLRTWVGDPDFPIILIADVYQSRPTPPQMAVYDRYVGAQLAIAQADPNVLVINARRLMEDIGWNATSGQSSSFIEDGVHYTALGAQSLASSVVSALMGEVDVSGCPNDPGAVSLQASMTLVVEIGGTTPCTNHGQLTVARALTLNQPTLRVALANSFAPAAGDQFKLLASPSVTGSFASVSLPTLPSELSWDTSALYTNGTLSVVATPAAPPPPTPTPEPPPPPPPTPEPPPVPAAPTINVTSGGNQSVTAPQSPAPIAFTLSGSGTLSVNAASSNTTVLPSSGLSISAGCGTETMTCTLTLSPASGQAGSATVSLTVADAHGQSASATASLEIAATVSPAPGNGDATEPGSTNNARGGGGGSLDLLSLFGVLLIYVFRTLLPSRYR